jgi:hypothetical protein
MIQAMMPPGFRAIEFLLTTGVGSPDVINSPY